MPTIEEILREAKEAGASDVHLTVGIPPKMRVNGDLITMNYSKMLPADTLDILLGIMSESQREKFEERGEYDFSFSIWWEPRVPRRRNLVCRSLSLIYISEREDWYLSQGLREAENPQPLPLSLTR